MHAYNTVINIYLKYETFLDTELLYIDHDGHLVLDSLTTRAKRTLLDATDPVSRFCFKYYNK